MIPGKYLFTTFITGLIFICCLSTLVLLMNTQAKGTASAHSAVLQGHSRPGRTQVILFMPSGVRSTSAQRGNCWIASLAAPRANAWRCMVANTIYDPCFSTTQNSSYVLCDPHPERGDARGLKVVLSQPLPKSEESTSSQQQAWLLRLSNDAVCSFETGGTFLVNGQRANYGCSDGSFVIGMPEVSSLWSVNVSKNVSPDQKTPPIITRVAVTTAWL